MVLYEPVKQFKAWNRHARWSLETMEWCSGDVNITNFSKILLKFAIVFKIFEFFSFSEFNDHYWPTKLFKSCRWVTWQKSRDQKCFWTGSLLRNVETFLWNFALSVFFSIVTNRFRKLENLGSNLIMEKIPNPLSLSLCCLAFLFFSFSLTFNLSLPSIFLLMPHFSGCYVAWCHRLLL